VKRLKKTAALLWALALLAGCAPAEKEISPQSITFVQMDTVMTITAYAEREVLETCQARVAEIESVLSAHDSSSEISSLNREGRLDQASELAVSLIGRGIDLGRELGGKFDISIRPMVALWDIKAENPAIPSDEKIEAARALVDYKNIRQEQRSISFAQKGMGVDLGGIAKGYAADEVMRILKENGVDSALFSLGGNVGLCGAKPDGSDWSVGIRDPKGGASDTMGILRLKDTFAVTSGSYERYFEQDGVRYHHIFDPATGRPADVSLISVTIISDDSTKADALSTALYVMDFEAAVEFYEAGGDFEMILIKEDGGVYASSGLGQRFTLLNTEDYYMLP
jgi:thiamine biosynthesis lipoprotein